jgi:hypothetical protein
VVLTNLIRRASQSRNLAVDVVVEGDDSAPHFGMADQAGAVRSG